MSIKYIERFPTPEEYNMLTDSVGWGTRKESIEKELDITFSFSFL